MEARSTRMMSSGPTGRWPQWNIVPCALSLVVVLALTSCQDGQSTDYGALGEKVRNILAMPTYEMVYKDISYFGQQEKFLGLITTRDKRLLFSVMVRVRAGLDLGTADRATLRIEPLPPDRDTDLSPGYEGSLPGARVWLPPATILEVDADDTSLYQYFVVEEGGRITRSDWEGPIREAKERIRQDAIDRGVLDHARDNAERLVRNLLRVGGIGRVEFIRAQEDSHGDQ